jgi:hypothetical protein
MARPHIFQLFKVRATTFRASDHVKRRKAKLELSKGLSELRKT